MIRTITYLIHSQWLNLNALRDINIHEYLGGLAWVPFVVGEIDRRLLREYRCPTCDKLLSKGFLKDKDSYLEVMCKNCKKVQFFTGEDAEIIKARHDLINRGVITGHELSEEAKKQE